jgi:acetyl esterase/lipase
VHEKRKDVDVKLPPKYIEKYFNIVSEKIDGFPIHTLISKEIKQDKKRRLIIYMHGGAYLHGPIAIQWRAMGEIAKNSNSDMVVLDYPKAPDYSCIKAIDYSVSVYKKCLNSFPNYEMIFLGDSAGGGLALALFMELRDLEYVLPNKMILLSPWVEVSMSNEMVKDYETKDAMLSKQILIEAGLAYAGELEITDYRVSPIYGNLTDMPITHIYIGGREMLYPDILEFARITKNQGVDVTVHFEPEMQHDWPIIPMLQEAKNTRMDIVHIIEN